MMGPTVDPSASEAMSIGEDGGRPLVTFALFAYNHERYVREAVEAAFAQTYEPLEIILSDDCSTDHTFEIMQEMAAAYRGPHEVWVNRTEENLGLFRHVLDVGGKLKGKLLVLAASDDVSKPQRTEQLVELWQTTGAWGLYSQFDLIDELGNCIESNLFVQQRPEETRHYLLSDHPLKYTHGATSAYAASIFKHIPNTSKRILHEDGVISLAINMLGGSIYSCNHSLVLYRRHTSSVSNSGDIAGELTDLRRQESKYSANSQLQLNALDYFSKELTPYLMQTGHILRRQINVGGVNRLRRFYEMKLAMADSGVFTKCVLLLKHRSLPEWRWLLPRLLGARVLLELKKARLLPLGATIKALLANRADRPNPGPSNERSAK